MMATETIHIPTHLVDVEDDLTIITKRVLEAKMRAEGNTLLDDKEAMKALEAAAKAPGSTLSMTDALKAMHRQFRMATGIGGQATSDDAGGDEGEEDAEPKVLVLPAQAKRQLGHDYFVTSLKYRDIDRLTVNSEVQRPESKKRIPEIADYVDKGDGYFGAIIVTAKGGATGAVTFDAAGDDEPFGTLTIEENAVLEVNDGQHRVAGIKRAIAEGLDEERLDDDLAMLVYVDLTTSEERQLFTDVNENAKKPPKAITNAFDERNLARRFAHALVESTVVFKGRTSFVKTKIGAKDDERFTFSTLVNAVGEMFDDLDEANFDARLNEATDFWRNVDGAIGAAWDRIEDVVVKGKAKKARSFAVTNNAMCAIARLRGMNVDWAKLGALDWSANGEMSRVAGSAGGTKAAVGALWDVLKAKVVE
jgi:DGQHR domain-containing protein